MSRKRIRWVSGVALFAGLWTTPGASARVVELERVTERIGSAIGLTHAGDGSGRLFIVQQSGRVLIHDGQTLLNTPFLDISSRVRCCGESGLLGLAFHPDYARNGRFYVDYTDRGGTTVVSEFRVSNNANSADAGSEVELLRIGQPFSNHNGGHIAFGPDGYLYIATGDGGSRADPRNNGQSLDTLLGKLLRIDVDRDSPFAVPGDNPFVGTAGEDEIWAYGLRNPWRFSFDRRTGDLYIGDVGQNEIEEINFQRASSSGGENYGWRIMEGAQCFNPATNCNRAGLTLPILQYSHADGCSVTGGFRYRGPERDTLPRFYLFGDFCSGTIWGGRPDSVGNWRSTVLDRTNLRISSFGEDQAGHVYVIDYSGSVYRMRGRPLFATDFESGDTGDWSERSGGLRVVGPGLGGSDNALEVPVDGTTARRFLRSNEPSGESIYQASFLINPQNVDLGNGEVEILRIEGSSDPVVLTLQQQRRKYFVALYVSEAGEDLRFVGRTKVPRRRAKRIGVDYLAARGRSAADGEVSLIKGTRTRARARGLRNGGQPVTSVVIGLPSGSAGAEGGAFLIDDFTSSP